MQQYSPPVCPIDGKDDSIQKASAIITSGTSTGSSYGSIQNNDGSTSYTSSSSTSQTRLAQLLNPPANPRGMLSASIFYAYVGLFILLLFAGSAIGSAADRYSRDNQSLQEAITNEKETGRTYPDYIQSIQQDTNNEYQTLVVTVIVSAIVIIPLVAFRIRWDIKHIPTRKRNQEKWLAQMAKWNTLYYCFRHDVVFIPGGQGVAPRDMKSLLI